MIWTKIKAAADAAASVVKNGYLLMWPQDDDGVISLKYKDSAGNIGTIAGGATDPISDHISIVNGFWYLDGVSTGINALGKSAYEVAVEDGYSGTKTQWLASLKGTTGATGYVSAIISETQPSTGGLQNGTIWIKP